MFFVSKRKYDKLLDKQDKLEDSYWGLLTKIGRLEVQNAEYFQMAQTAIKKNEYKRDKQGKLRDRNGQFAAKSQKEMKLHNSKDMSGKLDQVIKDGVHTEEALNAESTILSKLL